MLSQSPSLSNNDNQNKVQESSSSSESTGTGTGTCRLITVQPLVHEVQSRQLCAVHTLNNLLQLRTTIKASSASSESSISSISSRQNKHVQTTKEWMLINDHLYDCNDNGNIMLNTVATKEEFDIIADNLTQREQYLMKEMMMISNNDNDNDNELNKNDTHDVTRTTRSCDDDFINQKEKISLWDQLRSNHRSPFTGNYSLEVRIIILKKVLFTSCVLAYYISLPVFRFFFIFIFVMIESL